MMNWRSTFVQMAFIVVVFWGSNLLVTWAMNRYFPRAVPQVAQAVKPGQQFEASSAVYMSQPLKLEVDFVDTPEQTPEVKIDVPGCQSTMVFSTNAATIDTLTFERQVDNKAIQFTTITSTQDRESKAFLVGLDRMTPYFYTLKSQVKDEDGTVVTYQAETELARITKRYKVYRSRPLIDVDLTVEVMKVGASVQPRLFITAPATGAVTQKSSIEAIVCDASDTILKKASRDVKNKLWAQPAIFGLQDHYFAHLLVRDADLFAKRAYFKQSASGDLIAVLEGPSITEKKTWRMTFFCGPKEAAVLGSIDKRLMVLLDYGWFSWIAKGLMVALNWINGYTHNYGWAIIFLTLLLHLAMYPFTRRGEMGLQQQKELDRKVKLLKQKYADDPERFRQEQTELYTKHGLSPMLIGCLPIFIQTPIFFGLNAALRNAIELYHAPFVFWLRDLSVADPYYILPVAIGLSIFFSMKGAAASDPKQNTMSLIFTVLIVGVSINLSAGVNLFVLMGGVARLLQMRLMKSWKKA